MRRLNEATTLVRPLLDLRRRTLVDYLAQLGLGFRVDSSNISPHFLRNRLRHSGLPALTKAFGRDPTRALCRLSRNAAQWRQALVGRLAERIGAHVSLQPGRGEATFSPSAFVGLSRAERRELLAMVWSQMGWPLGEMGRRHWLRLLCWTRFGDESIDAGAPGDEATFPGGVVVARGERLTARKL